MTNEFEVMAIRLTNAETSFINAVTEQFDKTEDEAKIILDVFKKEKIVKLDIGTGQFSLSHGIFWDITVMNNALA